MQKLQKHLYSLALNGLNGLNGLVDQLISDWTPRPAKILMFGRLMFFVPNGFFNIAFSELT